MKFLDPSLTVAALLWVGLTASNYDLPMKAHTRAASADSKSSASVSTDVPLGSCELRGKILSGTGH
jgi:predicted transcriptional regulator